MSAHWQTVAHRIRDYPDPERSSVCEVLPADGTMAARVHPGFRHLRSRAASGNLHEDGYLRKRYSLHAAFRACPASRRPDRLSAPGAPRMSAGRPLIPRLPTWQRTCLVVRSVPEAAIRRRPSPGWSRTIGIWTQTEIEHHVVPVGAPAARRRPSIRSA